MGFHLKLRLELSKGCRGRHCEVPRKAGAVWDMPAASLHDDVFLDSVERHKRTAHCTSAYHDSLVGSSAYARGFEVAAKASCWVGCH